MGFFSWFAQDSGRSISNAHSNRGARTVYMKDNKGNVWVDHAYEGYGVFGGKDFYQLLAEMNVVEGLTGDVDNDRTLGIRLRFDNFKNNPDAFITPCLFDNEDSEWIDEHPVDDNDTQGFWY